MSVQSLSSQSIIDCLKSNYDIEVALLTLLPIGADMNASVYKAETTSRQSYFVTLKRGHRYDMSIAILALLQASGIQQIIPPIKTTDGKLTQHINDFTFTVYPFVNTYYRHERIVEDIAEYGQALLLTPDGGKGRVEMFKQFKDMFEPNGVIDIALKTDRYPHDRAMEKYL